VPSGRKSKGHPVGSSSPTVTASGMANEMVGKIASGEKNAAAVALGRMGGKARAAGMSARKRKEIARKAAATRWKKTP
jgi:hypothetical protein